MRIESRLYYSFILFRLVLLTLLTPLALLLPYVLITNGLGDAHMAMKIFLIALSSIGLLGVVGELYTYRHIFPKIVITDQGIEKRNFLGLGWKQYYNWTTLSGYDTGNISMKGGSAGIIKVFRNNRCVIEFNGVVYSNFEQLSDAVEKYLNRYPNGHRVD